MDWKKLGDYLIGATAVLLVLSGLLHLSVYGQIITTAGSGSPEVQAVMPLLWVCIGVDLIAFGIIVAVVGLENSNGGRWVLFAAAIGPIGAAIGQIVYLGIVPPTWILLLDGALAIAAGIVREPRKRRSSST